jgi:hypothetical protein
MNAQDLLEAIWTLQDLHRELIRNLERLLEKEPQLSQE